MDLKKIGKWILILTGILIGLKILGGIAGIITGLIEIIIRMIGV